jgi:predicted nuclease with TOPRIM domain
MFLVILALLLVAVVADVAVESALADGTSLVAAGQDLVTGLEPELVTLSIAAAAAVAGALLASAIGRVRRRRRGVHLTERREEISQAEASLEARRQMIESRLDELQRNHDEVLVKRDELLSEVERLRVRHDELEERVRERHREIATARRELADIRVASTTDATSGEPADDLTVVPDVAEQASEPPRR